MVCCVQGMNPSLNNMASFSDRKDQLIAANYLMAELAKGVQSIQNEGSLTIEEAFEGINFEI